MGKSDTSDKVLEEEGFNDVRAAYLRKELCPNDAAGFDHLYREGGLGKGNVKEMRALLSSNSTNFSESDSSDSFTDISFTESELRNLSTDEDEDKLLSEMSYSEILDDLEECFNDLE